MGLVSPYRIVAINAPLRAPHAPVDGYAGSAPQTALQPAPVVEPETASLPTGKRIILAGLASLGLAGGILGGLTASIPHPPQATVSQTRAATPEQARAESHALVDAMIEAGRNGRTVPPELRQRVHDALDTLPVDVVRTVARNGARIAIMTEGETPREVGVIKSVDLQQTFGDTAGLRRIADEAFAHADGKYAARIADLQQRLDQARAEVRARIQAHPEQAPKPQGLSGLFAMAQDHDPSSLDPDVQRLSGELQKARLDRAADAWDVILEQSGGRLEPYGANLGSFNPNIDAIMRMMPSNLETLAQMHGALTPAEQRAFMDQVIAMNGVERIKSAQQSFRTSFEQRNPGHPLPVLELEQAAFTAADSDVVLPSYYLVRTTEKPTVVSGHDFGSLRDWKAGATAGQYWFQDDRKTIVYHEKYLAAAENGDHTTVHEFGHAYEAALRAHHAPFYKGFHERWVADFRFDGEHPDAHRFPTGYAATNPGEFFAEEFATHFGPQHEVIEHRDPQAAALMQEALAEAPHTASTWHIANP